MLIKLSNVGTWKDFQLPHDFDVLVLAFYVIHFSLGVMFFLCIGVLFFLCMMILDYTRALVLIIIFTYNFIYKFTYKSIKLRKEFKILIETTIFYNFRFYKNLTNF